LKVIHSAAAARHSSPKRAAMLTPCPCNRHCPALAPDGRWKLLPNNSTRRSVFEEFCKNVGAEANAAKQAAARAAAEGFASLLEEFVALERRVAAEMEAALSAADGPEPGEAPMEEDGGEGGGGGSGDGGVEAAGAHAAPRSPGSIPEEELEGIAYDQLERYWGQDERWGAAPEDVRRRLFQERFGAALAAAEERREVRAHGQGWKRGGRGVLLAGGVASRQARGESCSPRLHPPPLRPGATAHTLRWRGGVSLAAWTHSGRRTVLLRTPPPPFPKRPPPSLPHRSHAQAARAERIAKFRALLVSLGVTARSRWTPLEEEVARHAAGAALASDAERERQFRKFVAEERVRPGLCGAWRFCRLGGGGVVVRAAWMSL
jgi:hypothetical protein